MLQLGLFERADFCAVFRRKTGVRNASIWPLQSVMESTISLKNPPQISIQRAPLFAFTPPGKS